MKSPAELSAFEQAAKFVRALPLEDYDRLRKIINDEEQKKRKKEKKLGEKPERFKKAEKWLIENREEFMGQWVCLYGDELISHGTDALDVHAKAKARGIESPFLERIVEEEKFFTGGWL